MVSRAQLPCFATENVGLVRFVYFWTLVRLGPYETLVDLGRGGMADLYVARILDASRVPTAAGGKGEHGDLVILKTLRPPPTDKRVKMFLDEGRLGLIFQHPNVVHTIDAGKDAASSRYFIAMEYLDGQPIDRIFHRASGKNAGDPLHVKSLRPILLSILAQSLGGLHYAHDLCSENGQPLLIVHRDFTPQNIFVTYDGRVKALDFGIAKSANRISPQTTSGEIKGKVRYMAPEQALGLRIDRRADVFSAGILLFELWSGVPFWKRGMTDREVFDDLVGSEYPTSIEDAPPGINDILAKSLARDASERYRTAQEMQTALLAEINKLMPLAEGADIARKSDTAKMISELFADQRERTAAMISNAQAQVNSRPSPAPAAPHSTTQSPKAASTAPPEVEETSTFKRLLSRIGLSILLVTTFVAATTTVAHAGEPAKPAQEQQAANTKEAEQHFQRGIKLFDEGDFKLALVELERSYDLAPNFRVLYNIGEVQFQLNNYAQALRTLTRYLEVGGDRILPNRRAEVERDIEALKIRTAHLQLSVDVDDAEILIDGERIGRSPLKDAELVDAGSHRIVVQKQGFVATNDSITLVGGDAKSLNIHLVPVPPKDERRVIEVRESSGLGPVWIGWGLTVALGIATVGSAVAWQNADGKLTDLKGAQSSSTERESQARTVDTLRTVTFVVGGATLVTAGVSLFLTLRRSSSSDAKPKAGAAFAPARLGLGFGAGSVSLSGDF